MTESYKALPSDSGTSPTTGRAKMTRSEAARHAALVRYGKENPFQARLAEIRAARQAKLQKKLTGAAGKKGGKGGKGKGGAKPKDSRTPQEKASQNRTAVTDRMMANDEGITRAGVTALGSLASGSGIDESAAGELEKMGLVERDSEGKPRATAQAQALLRATDKGDYGAALDAISHAKDKVAAGEKQAAREKTKAAATEQRKAAQAERQQAREKRAADRAKVAKEKAKAKAKSSNQSNTPKDKGAETAKNRSTVDGKVSSAGIDSAGMSALNSLANGDTIDEKAAGALEKIGLVERDSEGKPRATTQARALMRARDKGDAGAAMDAISRAKDKVAASAQRNATKKSVEDTDMPSTYTPILDDLRAIIAEATDIGADDSAIKIGKRNRASDQETIDQGYALAGDLMDIFETLGANTEAEDQDEADEEAAEGDTAAAEAAEPDAVGMKAIADDPVVYAYQECGGIQQATDALRILAQLAASEASEQDTDTPGILSKLRQAMQIITDFISGEIGEIKAIGAREDVNPKAGISKYGKGAVFADEKNKKYPLSDEQGALDEGKIRAAWNYINKPDNAGKYADDEVAFIKKKIVSAWKDKIDKAGPPSAQEATKKSLDDEWSSALVGDAVKALDGGRVGGLAIRFGSADEPDMSMQRDYFTKATSFWLDAWDRRPMLYHHALEENTADDPVIGTWTKAMVTDEGVWLEGELSKAFKYQTAIKELIRRGVLRISTDSAPHLVRRATTNGTNEVKRWPIICASLTVSPAEPRLSGVSFKALVDELGLTDDAALEVKTDDRSRAMLLELSLLELELPTA